MSEQKTAYYREWRARNRERVSAYNREWMRRYRAGLISERAVPVALCPECGARLGKAQQESYDLHDRYFRLRECPDCGLRYATVEVSVPGSFYDWADDLRQNRTDSARRTRGFADSNVGRYPRKRPALLLRATVVRHKENGR